MSCMFDKEIIQKYADNTIEPLEYIFLKEHVVSCEECRRETELAMTVEKGLEEFFIDDTGVSNLELMITRLVDDCMYEVNTREKLKYVLNNRIKTCSSVIDNSVRFLSFLPGTRKVNKGIKKTTSGAGGFLKAFLKKKVGKLLEGVVLDL